MAEGGDNFINKIGGGIDRKIDKWQNTFQETRDTEKGLFNRLFTDGDLWNSSIKDGAAFMASAFIPAGIISKFGMGGKVAGRLGKIATAIEAEATAANEIGAGSTIINSVNKFANLGKVLGVTQSRIAGTVDFATNLAYSVPMEAAMEARGVGMSVADSLVGKINPSTGLQYTTEEREKLSGFAAAQVYRQNLAVLALSNSVELFAMMKVMGLAGKAAKAQLKEASLLGKVEGQTNKFFNLKSLDSGIYTAAKGVGAGILSEGYYEENIQYAIQKMGEQFGATDDSGYGNIGIKNGIANTQGKNEGTLGRYAEQTNSLLNPFAPDSYDKELNESVFIGALMGAGGGGVSARKDFRGQNRFNQLAANNINQLHQRWISSYRSVDNPYETETDITTGVVKLKLDDTGNPIVDKNKQLGAEAQISDMLRLKTIADEAETKNNVNMFEIAKNTSFIKMASEYAKYGATDDLIKKLAGVSAMKEEDIKVLFPSLDTSNVNDPSFKSQLATKVMHMQNAVKEVEASHDFIEKNVLYSNPDKETVDNYNKEAGTSLKTKQVGEILHNARKQWLLDRSNENLALKMYDNTIKEDSIKLLAQLNDIQVGRNTLEDTEEVIAHDLSIDSANNLITKEKGLQSHIDGLEGNIKQKLSTNINGNTVVDPSIIDDVEEIEAKQAELDKISEQRKEAEKILKDSKIGTYQDPDGYHTSKDNDSLSLDELDIKQKQRINDIKREEIKLAQNKIIDEYKKVVAPVERKTGSKTFLSRNQALNKNQRNEYYGREEHFKDKSFKEKLRLVKDNIDKKKYVDNENKLLDLLRIREKVKSVRSVINGEKLLQEIQALLDANLPQSIFNERLKDIKEKYQGQPITIPEDSKDILNERLGSLYAELGEMQDDGRTIDPSPEDKAIIDNLMSGISELESTINFISEIESEQTVNLNDKDEVKKRIADQYTNKADVIIKSYNDLSNNGENEITGDTFSSKQEFDTVNEEIDEIKKLKEIFEDRHKDDTILLRKPFAGFITDLEERITKLEEIRDLIKDRMDSKARENQEFLKDTVELSLNELGFSLDRDRDDSLMQGTLGNDTEKLVTSLNNLIDAIKQTIVNQPKTKDEKDAQMNLFWELNGTISGIKQMLKDTGFKNTLISRSNERKESLVNKLKNTALYNRLTGEQKSAIETTIKNSVLGTLGFELFYSDLFTKIGLPDNTGDFVDDNPASPIFKFRNDLNISKLIRNLERDKVREEAEISNQEILDFVNIAKDILVQENFINNLSSDLNLVSQIELEKAEVTKKLGKDSEYDDFIVPSIQQLFSLRRFANFIKTRNVTNQDEPGYNN